MDRQTVVIERFENPYSKMVFYFADWCGHCKKAKPEFEKFSEKYPGNASLVNCSDNSVASEHGVQSFPTYRYFKSDQQTDYVQYKGGRDMSSIEQYFLSNK